MSPLGMVSTWDLSLQKSPGVLDSASRGHGTGLRAQRSRKSEAYREGRTIRFAWRWDGARPDVDVVYLLVRAAMRASRPVLIWLSGATKSRLEGSMELAVVIVAAMLGPNCCMENKGRDEKICENESAMGYKLCLLARILLA